MHERGLHTASKINFKPGDEASEEYIISFSFLPVSPFQHQRTIHLHFKTHVFNE